MVTKVRTLDFLPEIFQTRPNKEFLGATLDQIVSQPNTQKIQGYIGRKFEYGLDPNSKYVIEPNKVRTDYQLEPGVIFTKPDTSVAKDALTYPGLVDAIQNEGGTVTNHSTLFSNEFYSWDSFVDLDKLTNFSQYYWLPDGPDVVPVSTEYINSQVDYTVAAGSNLYSLRANGKKMDQSNPPLTMVRGGIYNFIVNQKSNFWIQTELGTSGKNSVRTNISSREIFGVTNNGANKGIVSFTVPDADAQDEWIFPGEHYVDFVSKISITEIHGKYLSQLIKKYPNGEIDGIIDGVNNLFNGKTLMFYGFDPDTTATLPRAFDLTGFDDEAYDDNSRITYVNDNIYYVEFFGEETGDPLVTLKEYAKLPTEEKITVINGVEFLSHDFVRTSLGEILEIPPISAPLNTLYYQDSLDPAKFGIINILDEKISNAINVEKEILGKTEYVGPNGVKFTNGLKVRFQGSIIPETFKKGSYYVEGVGTGIVLVPAESLNVVEPFSQVMYTVFDSDPFDTSNYGTRLNMPVQKDYITIERKAANQNAWSRSNRWFHIEVLKATAEYVSGKIALAALNNIGNRANRPIIEFYHDLKLFDFGTEGKGAVQFVDTTSTTAFDSTADDRVAGKTIYYPDGLTIPLFEGARIIFTKDKDVNVRNKIFIATLVSIDGISEPTIVLTKTADGDVLENDQVFVTHGTARGGKSYYFDGSHWIQSQQKDYINQPPKFDILDKNHISLSSQEFYPGSNFIGCTLFEYAIGTGSNDPVLGFPIKYSSAANIGDISFKISLNDSVFQYTENFQSITKNVSIGYPHRYTSRFNFIRELGWKKAVGESFQFQAYNFIFNPDLNNYSFTCDVVANLSTSSLWPVIRVYVNEKIQTPDEYTITRTTSSTVVKLKTIPLVETPVQILIHSDGPLGKNAYYTIPSNLSSNPFNVPIADLSLGDIRGHYQSIFVNSEKITGDIFGSNNYRDKGNLIPYGDKIIQNSAPLTIPAALLRNRDFNLSDALTYNSNEYVKFKLLVVNLVENGDYTVYDSTAFMLDDALQQIASYKFQESPFFWSDMLPARAPTITNTYTFNAFIATSYYSLSRIYDFENANYYGVLIYLQRVINGVQRTIQLVRNVDYTIDNTEPKVTMTLDLLPGDSITVNEYTQTYGSFVPNTPSKLGLYPVYIPKLIQDTSYINDSYFIRGHDGSLTKTYGDVKDGYPIDFRDRVLLEFETRIYNNIKVNAKTPVTYDDVVPGQFRTTDYSYDTINSLLNVQFLNWVGQNRIDYKYQYYLPNNKFTYNFDYCTNILDGSLFKQGNWRGIFLHFYDTSTPHTTPWEMLGFADEPVWWTSRYGAAPYTSENAVLWDDLEAGVNYNNGNPVVIPSRVRPGLSRVIPVDSQGNLRNVLDFLTQEYDDLTFQRSWKAGDLGPSEYSYLKSSTYPFDLIKMLATCKPAKFFSLSQDLDVYQYNNEFGQYLVNDRYRISYGSVKYGTGVAQHGYVNWIVDYIQNSGINGQVKLTELLANLDVRLVYRLAGFSDKDLLNFYLEKSSGNAKSASLLVPDNSYSVLLYENQPYDRITYSGVIIQRTERGYKVYGNSQNKAFFNTYTPRINGKYEKITIDSDSLNVSGEFTTDVMTIPYGTEYNTLQGLAEFIINYGRFLNSQGMSFESIENGIEINWTQMIAELMYWTKTGWEVGSTINLNPAANILKVNKENTIVQPLTLHHQNFVLNQDLIPIQLKDLTVTRNETEFSVMPLNSGDTIAYFVANLSNMEHIVVFDNYTLFNDTIYNTTTSLRQYRIMMKGVKTAEWNGTVNAHGFILNQDNVNDWVPNVKYSKGTIVKYKNYYWMAMKLVQPATTFNPDNWIKTNYDKIQKGLLPNASNRAYESTLYYDVNNTNLESDANLLGFSLIGYRPRNYLAESNLDDISQVNVFKNIIAEKGTKLVANAVQNITLTTGKITYEVYENWAIKTSEYGGVNNDNFIEFVLNEQKLVGNPNIVSVIKDELIPGSMQQVPVSAITNFGKPLSEKSILPLLSTSLPNKLPSAGPVHFDDVSMYSYTFAQLKNNEVPMTDLYQGDYIWVAEDNGTWRVYTPAPIITRTSSVKVITCINNLNNTATLTFDDQHGLVVNDYFMVLNFDSRVDNYFSVISVPNVTSVIVNLVLSPEVARIDGSGISAKFQSQRVAAPKDAADLGLVDAGFTKSKVWVDQDVDGSWAVYQKQINYKYGQIEKPTGTVTYGSAVAYDKYLGWFATDSGAGKLHRHIYQKSSKTYPVVETISIGVGFGVAMVKAKDTLIVSKPGYNSQLYVYKLANSTSQTIVQQNIITISGRRAGDALAISGDTNWLFVSDITNAQVLVYKKTNDYTYTSVGTLSVSGLVGLDTFGCSISTNYDGSKVFVGAPGQNYSQSLPNTGYAYAFNRISQTFTVNQNLVGYDYRELNLAWTPESSQVSVYCNGVALTGTTDYTLVTNKIRVTKPLTAGDIVTVDSSDFVYTQQLIGWDNEIDIRSGASLGRAVDTNKYATELLVGAPYDISPDNKEGSVYRFTNAGKRYGIITGTSTVTLNSTATILINGYAVALPSTGINDIVDKINSSLISNIYADKTSDNKLIIGLRNVDLGPINNKLNITTFTKAVLDRLGISEYIKTQTIRDVEEIEGPTQFGYSIKFNEQNSFAIGAPVADRLEQTTFDFSDDSEYSNDTLFDNNFTKWVDNFKGAGAVYIYDYLPSYNESIDNVGKYVVAQTANDLTGVLGYDPHYGKVLSFNDYVLLVGCPSYQAGRVNGRAVVYVNSYNKQNWQVYRKSNEIVDTDRLLSIQLFDNRNSERIESLDYIDPLQGKLLGAVGENLDFITSYDPAGYNNQSKNGNLVWVDNFVGKMWFNTSTTRFINYHQSDIVYNGKHWGKIFPGSTVTVYTWIESSEMPMDYTGSGTPYDPELYSTTFEIDSSGALVPNYYYWVRNTNTLYEKQGKTLTDTIIESYIANPQDSGISYFAALQPNSYGLFNCREYINASNTSIHIGFGDGTNKDSSYNEYKLIRDGYKDDFLAGVPSAYTSYAEPEALYNKLLDSLSGIDSFGKLVPDINLPKLVQQGINIRPRQSFFKDRLKALENYCVYANSILKQYPIAEYKTPASLGATNNTSRPSRAPAFLTTSGEYFNTADYWEYVYWWADGYNNNTKTDMEVPKYYGLATLIPFNGMVVGVLTNSDGKREVYAYQTDSWVRVGLEQGTMQIKSSLWDYEQYSIGFGNNFYDTLSFDTFPYTETRYIIRAINEEIFTGELQIYRNKALILLFEYIVSEATSTQSYLPWLNKTSLVDVNHTIRKLEQTANYQRDNQNFLEGYMNEVKPYHVVIKEFAVRYTANDTFTGQVTDFDLPALYDRNMDIFVTPNLTFNDPQSVTEFLPTDKVWTDTLYNDWLENYGLSLTGKTNYNISTLLVYIAAVSDSIYITNAYGFPVIGKIIIDNETILYNGIDREKSMLYNITRGAGNSDAVPHNPGAKIYMDLPRAMVLDTGRNYIDPPTITAYINTNIYPAPIREANLVAIMDGDKLVGINVKDPGAGYATAPEILIKPVATIKFNSDKINYRLNTINIDSTLLVTGDVVKFIAGTGPQIKGLDNNTHYYVGIITKDVLFGLTSIIALYTTKSNAIADSHRIEIVDQGLSTNNRILLTAKAVAVTSNTPTREITTTLKFDRTSYVSKVSDWVPGEYYSSKFLPSGTESSQNTLLSEAVVYEKISGTVARANFSTDPDAQDAVFTVYNNVLLHEYSATLTYSGRNYQVGDAITLSGSILGGETPLNDCIITVTALDIYGGLAGITDFTVSGAVPTAIVRASIQSAVLPISSVSTEAKTKEIIITTDYSNLNVSPGQIKGLSLYFYKFPRVYNYVGPSRGGARIKFYRPNFAFNKVYNEYFIEITDPGSIYTEGQEIRIKGSILGGVDGVNDAVIKVIYTINGGIALYELRGLAVGSFKQLYVKPISDTKLKVYYDAPMVHPVIADTVWSAKASYVPGNIVSYAGSCYRAIKKMDPIIVNIKNVLKGKSYFINESGSNDWTFIGAPSNAITSYPFTATKNGSLYITPSGSAILNKFNPANWKKVEKPFPFGTDDKMYLPEPVIITSGYSRNPSSLVALNGVLYKCIESNNDTVFNFNKWEELKSGDVELNALDRIMGFYKPTINMPGKNLPALLSGIEYPNNTYYSNKFNDDLTLDTVLKDQPFYPRDIKIKSVIYDGEKLLAIADGLAYSMVLISKDEGITWVIHRISNQVMYVTDIIKAENHYVITTSNSQAPVFISYDALTWIGIGGYTPYDTTGFDEPGISWDSTSAYAPSDKLYNVSSYKNLHIAVGDEVITSVDGYGWNTVYNPKSVTYSRFNHVSYISTKSYEGFVAVGMGIDNIILEAGVTASNSGPVGKVILSENGSSWFELWPRPIDKSLNSVVASDDLIIAVGDNGALLYSLNAQNWLPGGINGLTLTVNLLASAYGLNAFVAVGESGTVLLSYDGIAWDKVISNTTQTLHGITFDGQHFIAVGDNATVIRSFDGLIWENISTVGGERTFYEIKGDAFMSGYGPEEMVSGVMNDNLSITVITKAGSTWDPIQYGHSGFIIKTLGTVPVNNKVNFSNLTDSPAQVAVFILDNISNLGRRIYPNIIVSESNPYTYTVNWLEKTITLNTDLQDNEVVYLEVYEFGSGNQVIRSTSLDTPVRVDSITGNSEIHLDYLYEKADHADPVVYINGVEKIFGTDFILTSTATGLTKILFNRLYSSSDYMSFVVFISSPQNYQYSIPKTEVFTYTLGDAPSFALSYFMELDNIDNAIVEVNGLRLVKDTDYSIIIDSGTRIPSLAVTAVLAGNDIVSVTSYNDTSQQYLLTETINTLQVTPIYFVNPSKGIVILYTTSDPGFESGDIVQIDGILGSTQLNNNEYWVKMMDPYQEEDITLYPMILYLDFFLSKNVVSSLITPYISGGFIWKQSTTHQINQSDITLTDTSRLFVTINGQKIADKSLRLNSNNLISILSPINQGDNVIITSMISSATPNQLIYLNDIDKNGDQLIYRISSRNKTWLTSPLGQLQDTIYVKDVSKLVDIVNDNYIVQKLGEEYFIKVKYDFETIKQTTVRNITSISDLANSDFVLVTRNSIPLLIFRKNVEEGDEISVTMRLGDMVTINGEKIRFKKVDYIENTLKDLTRGALGTAINVQYDPYTSIAALNPTNVLFNYYYDKTWNSEIYDPIKGDPIQISDSHPAEFLQAGIK
jgi:hypothetical protein